MEATIVHIGGGPNGLARATYQAKDEHALARRIQTVIDEAHAEGRNVKLVVDDEVGTLLESHGYVSFVPTR